MPAFDKLDDVLSESARPAEGADAKVQPWQAALKRGDFCVVLHGDGENYLEILEASSDYWPLGSRLTHPVAGAARVVAVAAVRVRLR